MNQTFLGCEIVDHLIPDQLRQQLNVLTPNPVIKPDVRSKGLTAGQIGRCYWNSSIMTQTIGGETVYGWMIKHKTNPHSGKCIYSVYGHGCWLTPEGKLVDVTNHLHSDLDKQDYIGFLPATDVKLVLNAKSYSSLNNFYFVQDRDGLFFSLASELKETFVPDEEDGEISFTQEEEVQTRLENGGCLILVRGVDPSFCKYLASRMKVDSDRLWRSVEPVVYAVSADTPISQKHDKTFDLNHALAKSYRNGEHLFKENLGHDVLCPMRSHHDGELDSDATWNIAFYFQQENSNFVNPSLKGKHKGMIMQDIPPSEKFLNQLPLPAKKTQLKQLQKIADGYGLTLREANVLSHPHFFPHPYLVKKAGGKVSRVKDHMLLAA